MDTRAERSLSVVDQRQRFVSSFTSEPNPFGRDHAALAYLFNDWKFSGIFSAGSGRPLSGHIDGDANRDANTTNDRLPGVRRNSFLGPDYFSGDARITRAQSLVLYPAQHHVIGRRLAAQFGCRAEPVKGGDVFLVLLGRDAALRPARSRG